MHSEVQSFALRWPSDLRPMTGDYRTQYCPATLNGGDCEEGMHSAEHLDIGYSISVCMGGTNELRFCVQNDEFWPWLLFHTCALVAVCDELGALYDLEEP